MQGRVGIVVVNNCYSKLVVIYIPEAETEVRVWYGMVCVCVCLLGRVSRKASMNISHGS